MIYKWFLRVPKNRIFRIAELLFHYRLSSLLISGASAAEMEFAQFIFFPSPYLGTG
jgi:hypothetical protein